MSNVTLKIAIATYGHTAALKDGRVMFSSLETQGLRSDEAGASGPSTLTGPTGRP